MVQSENPNGGDDRISQALRQMLESFGPLMQNSYLVDTQMPPGKLLAPVPNTRPIDDLPEPERQFRKDVLKEIVLEVRQKGEEERGRARSGKPPRSPDQ
ncbi:hypothetical protein ACWCQP_06510 [Streptomyces chartreusis]|uniref:hypothetical protein n=1 Tax=Streptomyces chartreusis TaxID=1969 RepID=UPI0033D25861